MPRHDVIWPFRLFCYVLPYGWAQPSITYHSMINADDWDGARQHSNGAVTAWQRDGVAT